MNKQEAILQDIKNIIADIRKSNFYQTGHYYETDLGKHLVEWDNTPLFDEVTDACRIEDVSTDFIEQDEWNPSYQVIEKIFIRISVKPQAGAMNELRKRCIDVLRAFDKHSNYLSNKYKDIVVQFNSINKEILTADKTYVGALIELSIKHLLEKGNLSKNEY